MHLRAKRPPKFHNFSLQTTTMTKPIIKDLPEGWIAQWDAEYQCYFYVNTYTRTSQWEVPTEKAIGRPSSRPLNQQQQQQPIYQQQQQQPIYQQQQPIQQQQEPVYHQSSGSRGIGSSVALMGAGALLGRMVARRRRYVFDF